jgi:hypothetical protein
MDTGTPRRPTSQEATVCWETSMVSASWVWVMLEVFLSSAMRAPIALKKAFSSWDIGASSRL